MDIHISTPKLTLTDRQREYILRKVDHWKKVSGRFWDEAVKCRIEFKESTVPNEEVICHVKLPFTKETLFAESKEPSVEAAIDIIEDRLERQIRKFKTKHTHRGIH